MQSGQRQRILRVISVTTEPIDIQVTSEAAAIYRAASEEDRRKMDVLVSLQIIEFASANDPASKLHLLESLSGYVGVVSGTGEALSEDCGRRFAEGVVEKHDREHL
jgi:hypothetical protein